MNDYGTLRVVAETVEGVDDHGYPHVTVVFEDGKALVHNASYEVEVEK